MMDDKIYSMQHEWSEKALFLMRELLPMMAPVPTASGWGPEESRTMGELLSATARSTESVLLLCAYGQLWDAEIVLRSIVEGTLKFARLLQSRESFKERFGEFATDLRDIAFVKDHDKAKSLLAALQDPDNSEWEPIRQMLLPEYRVKMLRERYPSAKRRDLDRMWGFTGILADLAKSDDSMFKGITGLAHSYSIFSHLTHADQIGIALPMERDRRSQRSSESTHLAHLSRIISDVFSYFMIRLYVGYRYVNCSPEALDHCQRRIDDLLAPGKEYYRAWLKQEYNLAPTGAN
jgi:hypothetical protein